MAAILLELFESLIDFVFYVCSHALLWLTGIEIKDEHKKDLVLTVLGALLFALTIGVLIYIAG